MKKNILILFLFLFFIPPTPTTEAYLTSPYENTDINEDGYTESNFNTRYNTSDYMEIDRHVTGAVYYVGWVEWDVSMISDSATISSVSIRFRNYNTYTEGVRVINMTDQPTTMTAQQIYLDIIAEDPTAIWTGGTADEIFTIELNATAVSTLQNNLVNDFYAIGLLRDGASDHDRRIYSSEGGYSPCLIVESDWGSYTITVNGLYFENGNNSGYVELSSHDADGDYTNNFTDQIVLGFNATPILIDWPVDTDTRRIYLTTDATQEYYLFTPHLTYAAYDFTIIDYTGRLGEGAAYLEAYKTINGTERLVERMEIQEGTNTAPMTLLYQKTYRLKILWSDGTEYDWGYFLPGTDYTPTIVLTELTFSQRAQMSYQWISIEATRPNATHIQVNYEDTAPDTYGTDWCNITVAYRNGTIVTTYNSSSETLTWNWYAADNVTDYWVFVDIDHGFFNDLEYAKLLDYDRSYSTFPSLEILGTFGGMNAANLFSLMMVLGVFGGFSRRSADVALISAFCVAGILRIVGANTWSYDVLLLGLALSIGFAVYRGRVGI